MIFIYYPKCTTCLKAKKWLDNHCINYTERHIKEDKPSAHELKTWHQKSGLPLKKFFNTSGLIYKSLKLKEKLPNMTSDEMYNILASDGMLVKRPLIIMKDKILIGFNEKEWEKTII
ncbi:MAG: arsenate reductase family protein [Treponema sp.]